MDNRAIFGKIAVFCFSSSGELDVMLPLLKVCNIATFSIVAFKSEIVGKISEDSLYSELIEGRLENRSLKAISKRKIYRWLQFIGNSLQVFRKFRRYDFYFLEYGLSGREKNVLIALLVLSGRAGHILFHPHGHAVTPKSGYAEANWPPIIRYAVKHGARIVRLDGCAPDARFVPFEYPILHNAWRAYVRANVPSIYEDHVVILSRDVHPDYLLEHNRAKMLEDVIAVVDEYYPGCRIVIKAHPRETFAGGTCIVNGRTLEVTYENTYAVVRGAKLAISFWTSAFFQCMSLDVPAVEYHIPHDRFRELYPNGSLNATFIPRFESREDLVRHVAALTGRASPIAQ